MATASSVDELLTRAQIAFASARTAVGVEDRDLILGGRRVRMSFAGDGLRKVFDRALAVPPAVGSAPAADDVAPSLNVYVWCGRQPGTTIPFPAAVVGFPGRLGLAEQLCDERHLVQLGPIITIADLERGEAFIHAPDLDRLPYWELAHPARVLFAAWAPTVRMRMCHAAAVGDEQSGLLFAGAGGSGKSTVALACLGAGMRCAGDDYVLLEEGPNTVAHSLYSSTLLTPDHRRRWPMLMPRVDNADGVNDGEKAVMFAAPGSIQGGFPVAAVVVPRVGAGARMSVRAITPARALRALAPSSILQLGAFDPGALAYLGELCRSRPCLELTLGPDVRDTPGAVREALSVTRAQSRSLA